MSNVFRVIKNCNYTTLSNYHFKDKRLSWKAKGLLSTMLSLPDDWNYSIEGLAKLSDDGIKATNSGLAELEKHGYLIRRQLRNDNGHFCATEYSIYEQPVSKAGVEDKDGQKEIDERTQENDRISQPVCQNGQTAGNTTSQPLCQKRQTGKRQAEKGEQLNTNILNTKELNTYSSSSSDEAQIEMRKRIILDDEAKYRLRKRLDLERIAENCSRELTEAVFKELCKRELGFIELMNAKALEQVCISIAKIQQREPIRMLPNMINRCLDNIMLGIKATGSIDKARLDLDRNLFKDFQQNHYDFDALEKEILENW